MRYYNKYPLTGYLFTYVSVIVTIETSQFRLRSSHREYYYLNMIINPFQAQYYIFQSTIYLKYLLVGKYQQELICTEFKRIIPTNVGRDNE
jgi:hypothetical protein